MIYTAGIDVGSTYTKAIVMGDGTEILGRAIAKTGFRLPEVAKKMFDAAIADAGVTEGESQRTRRSKRTSSRSRRPSKTAKT